MERGAPPAYHGVAGGRPGPSTYLSPCPLQVHFAEEWNEAHHLLIMESLGGDQAWVDRFIAQHAAVVYYVALNIMWFIRWVWT